MQGPTLQSRTYFTRALMSLSLPLECVICGGGWVVVFLCGLKLPAGYTGAPESPGGTDKGQVLPVFCPELPGISYSTICRWLLLVWGL